MSCRTMTHSIPSDEAGFPPQIRARAEAMLAKSQHASTIAIEVIAANR